MKTLKKMMLAGLLAVATVQEVGAFSLKNIYHKLRDKMIHKEADFTAEELAQMEASNAYFRDFSRDAMRAARGGVLFTGCAFALCGLIDYATKKKSAETNKVEVAKKESLGTCEQQEETNKKKANWPLKIPCFAGAGICAIASAGAAALAVGLPLFPYELTALNVAAMSSAGLSYYLFKLGLNY